MRIIVAAVIFTHGCVLVGQRTGPAGYDGLWEFPGGRVEAGETDADALARECQEELAVGVAVGRRIGPDVPITPGAAVLRAYLAEIRTGTLQPLYHRELRWLGPGELTTVPWAPADTAILPHVAPLLAAGGPSAGSLSPFDPVDDSPAAREAADDALLRLAARLLDPLRGRPVPPLGRDRTYFLNLAARAEADRAAAQAVRRRRRIRFRQTVLAALTVVGVAVVAAQPFGGLFELGLLPPARITVRSGPVPGRDDRTSNDESDGTVQ